MSVGQDQEDGHEDHHGVKEAVKGFLGKLRPKVTALRQDSFGSQGSSEDVSPLLVHIDAFI